MKFRELSGWIPLTLIALFVLGVLFQPVTMHNLAVKTFHGASVMAFGNDAEPPQQINLRLPSPNPPSAQDGPPTTWNN